MSKCIDCGTPLTVKGRCRRCEMEHLRSELAKAQAQNARLRDLLGPTVELLKDGVLSWEGEGPAVSQTRFKAELARLRAVMEGKV